MESRLDMPAMKRTSDWILSQEFLSQEFPSDITIQVGESTFNLHKLPMASRCGYIRKQVSGINGSKSTATHLEITGMPGGAKAFELVVKFCYGEKLEITEDNVATLRCAAERLEMTDDAIVAGNLVGRTEAYLEAVALASLAGAVAVLRKAEELLPVAEQVGLVSRCVDAIACITCNDSQFSMSLGATADGVSLSPPKAVDDWWADGLTDLRIDTFQRVLIAMKARGFKGVALGTLIMLYAQKSLRKLNIMHGREMKKMDPRQEHEKRVAHPSLNEVERKNVCKVMDCQKLSHKACAHAAQNDRLPVQTVVQVLYHEQRRLRDAIPHPPSPEPAAFVGASPAMPYSYKPSPPTMITMGRDARSVPDEVARLQRENEELKMEILRLKMRLRDVSSGTGGIPASGRPPLPKKAGAGFVNSVSKKLGRLNPFMRLDNAMGGGRVRAELPKDRRHSIS
ncbi:hypothetical protein EJB05_07618 [Eragrostis curvula]|uniref:BTB domain-containing protein n=1 Tax=Eragrostis curvula TaxID=38414 RepID=A0A5J9WI82_9POAL|nr:hypothetical protein EJB05_07618 [Eragrostis curvula]